MPKCGFTRATESYGMNHVRIPPGCSNANAHVETSHRWIEDEFYDIDPPRVTQELLAKAYCYQVYFNTQRRNFNKGYKTPVEILQAIAPHVHPQVAVLPPVLLDSLLARYPRPGYHVPELTEIFYFSGGG